MVNYEFFIETAMDGLLLKLDFEIKPRIMIFMIWYFESFKASFESSISPTPDTKETATQASRIFFFRSTALCALYAIRISDQSADQFTYGYTSALNLMSFLRKKFEKHTTNQKVGKNIKILAQWWTLVENIAKGTTDPRVEFILAK